MTRKIAVNCESHSPVFFLRKPSNTQPSIQPTRLIRSKSNDDDPFHLSRDFISAAAAGARDSGHVGTNLQNGQDSMPPLAWTLDGHIRVSDIPRSRSLPIPDFVRTDFEISRFFSVLLIFSMLLPMHGF